MSVPMVLSAHYQQHLHEFAANADQYQYQEQLAAALAPAVYRAGGVPIAFRTAELPSTGTAPAAAAAAVAAGAAALATGVPPGHYHHHQNNVAAIHHPLLDHHRQAPAPAPASAPAPAPPPRMATDGNSSAAYMASDEEIAHLQKLSSEYEPEATGPLISERQPTSRITTEYANADPIYIAKTAVLPQKYSEYRTCRGDGHCGWRAIAFSYFETLQRLADKHKFHEEESRLTSLKNLLNSVGFQEELYEDFAEETFELLRNTSTVLPVADNGAALLAAFNDQGISMAIITHLKLLTSAWIQTHPNDFAPFILGQDIKQYCATEIEPSICELDNVGLNALVEALVKPAGLALEVTYLDRSQGDEMNVYRYEPEGLASHSAPTIRLLYRPGHYDILYKPEDSTLQPVMHPAPMQSNVYVGFAGPVAEYMPQDLPASRGNPEIMTMVPGMLPGEYGFNEQQWSNSFEYATESPFPALVMAPLNYSPVSPQTEQSSAAQSPQEYPAPPQEFPTSPLGEFSQPTQDFHSPQEYPHAAPAAAVEAQLPGAINRPLAIRRSEPFRPSAYELEPSFGASRPRHMPCQTSIFRNSHYNTAHYMNPDFHPEEWSPDHEYGPAHRHRSRTKSTSH